MFYYLLGLYIPTHLPLVNSCLATQHSLWMKSDNRQKSAVSFHTDGNKLVSFHLEQISMYFPLTKEENPPFKSIILT